MGALAIFDPAAPRRREIEPPPTPAYGGKEAEGMKKEIPAVDRVSPHPTVTGTSVIVSLPKMSMTFTAMV